MNFYNEIIRIINYDFYILNILNIKYDENSQYNKIYNILRNQIYQYIFKTYNFNFVFKILSNSQNTHR